MLDDKEMPEKLGMKWAKESEIQQARGNGFVTGTENKRKQCIKFKTRKIKIFKKLTSFHGV